MAKVFKNIILILGLFAVVLIMIGILFYEFVPNGIDVKDPNEYVADEKVTKTLAAIKDEEDELFGTSSSSDSNTQTVIHAYSLDAGDLAVYEQSDSYVSGKSDPFSALPQELKEDEANSTGGTTSNNNSSDVSNNNSNNNNNSNTNTSTNNDNTNTNVNTNNLTEVKDNTLLNSGNSK